MDTMQWHGMIFLRDAGADARIVKQNEKLVMAVSVFALPKAELLETDDKQYVIASAQGVQNGVARITLFAQPITPTINTLGYPLGNLVCEPIWRV